MQRPFRCCGLILLVCVAAPGAVLQLERRIPLPAVKGRIDHLAIDLLGNRLFVAAPGNNTLEVVDLAAGQRTGSIRGLHEPQGVAYVPELNRIFVANGGDGICRVFDGSSLRPVGAAKFYGDADNLRYDPAAGRIYVGYGDGSLGAVEASTAVRVADVSLPGHPESFQLEKSGPLIFVNVPRAAEIAVLDRRHMSLFAHWPVRGAGENYPLALDEEHQRLFTGCRKPPRVLVYNSVSGKEVTSFDCAGDADDLFFDAVHKRIYVSGGEGFLTVEAQRDPDRYESLERIPTAPGARTSLFVPERSRLYLAVPEGPGHPAEIRIFQVQ